MTPEDELRCILMDSGNVRGIDTTVSKILAWHNKEIEKLQAENKELRACHEAELGVCQEHCDEIKKLQARIKELEANIERLEIELYGRKLQTKP